MSLRNWIFPILVNYRDIHHKITFIVNLPAAIVWGIQKIIGNKIKPPQFNHLKVYNLKAKVS